MPSTSLNLCMTSIEDLGGDVSKLARDDAAHFAGNTEPFRHWDGKVRYLPVVPNATVQAVCHSSFTMPALLS